jgi:hypothetical protein
MGALKNAYRILVENRKGNEPLEGNMKRISENCGDPGIYLEKL